MPLSPPAPRTLKHVRRVNYQGFERSDGLWDIEGELHDSKAYDAPSHRNVGTIRLAGQPIHHMWLRVTVNLELVVQTIEVVMDTHPLKGCRQAEAAMQRMVGCGMARGWRQAIQKNLGGIEGCTHLRELLFNMATAAFQSVPAVFSSADPTEPPRHLGQCTGWDFNGEGVKEYYPQFYGRSAVTVDQAGVQSAAAAQSAAPPSEARAQPKSKEI